MQQTKYESTLESADICNESYNDSKESSMNDSIGDNKGDSNGDNKEGHNALNMVSYKRLS